MIQPLIKIGVVMINIFFLPSHADATPPKGETIIPVIHKIAAKIEPSYSSRFTSKLVSFFNLPKQGNIRGWMHLIYEYFGIGTFQLILMNKNKNDTSN